jgi:hypothetical protein
MHPIVRYVFLPLAAPAPEDLRLNVSPSLTGQDQKRKRGIFAQIGLRINRRVLIKRIPETGRA